MDLKLIFLLKEFGLSGFNNLENSCAALLSKHGQQTVVGESLNGSKQSW